MTRWIVSIASLAFACCLFLAGCDDKDKSGMQKPPPPPPAAGDVKKDVPPVPPAGGTEKKTASATGAVNDLLGAAQGAAKDAAAAMTCGKAGCTAPGKADVSCKSKDGKVVLFCCVNCRNDYKKANNIE